MFYRIFKGIFSIKLMLTSFVKVKEVFILFSFSFFVRFPLVLVLSVTSHITKSPRGPGESLFFFFRIFHPYEPWPLLYGTRTGREGRDGTNFHFIEFSTYDPWPLLYGTGREGRDGTGRIW